MLGISLETTLIVAAIFLILSVAASKLSDRFGIPALLFFLVLGMLAGSDGPGGVYFDNSNLAQNIGVIALIVILFSGGLDTDFESIRPIYKESITLATLGVLLTALITGGIAHLTLNFGWLESILLGAIVSSTDAAAVFSILRSKGLHLKGNLRPTLELESGSNDPMAVFLTIGLISLITHPEKSALSLVSLFALQMIIGAGVGYVFGKLTLFLINRLKLGYEGLYPVLSMGTIFLAFGLASIVNGSGFLAVYILGLMMSREEFLHKHSLLRFYDGLAWLMQIIMFLTLGLLVYPSRVAAVALPSLALSLALIFLIRPLSVFISLVFSKFSLREKGFISWVGLRGAVPVILATYPKLAGIPQSDFIFNVVFFVVITSVLFQGISLPFVAKLLGVGAKEPAKLRFPIAYVPEREWPGVLKETLIPNKSWAVGKAIYQVGLPPEYLVVLVARGEDFILPNGSIVLQAGDTLLGLGQPELHQQVEILLTTGKRSTPT
ncbi:MAG: potassium/proton antiporter [Anaerolineaceae bacterium]|nr:potassium/proton antiporter [Anaerolineaceae bacterium]